MIKIFLYKVFQQLFKENKKKKQGNSKIATQRTGFVKSIYQALFLMIFKLTNFFKMLSSKINKIIHFKILNIKIKILNKIEFEMVSDETGLSSALKDGTIRTCKTETI